MTMSFESSEPIINANPGDSGKKKSKRKKEDKKVGSTPFPVRLHNLLDDAERNGFDHVISWQPDGSSFKVKEPDAMEDVLPKYFKLTKYRSFLRQLQDYGFSRVTWGEQTGLCSHPFILRGQRHLCKFIYRKPAGSSTPGLRRMTAATAQFQAVAVAGRGFYPLQESQNIGGNVQFPVHPLSSTTGLNWTYRTASPSSSPTEEVQSHSDNGFDMSIDTSSDTASYNGSERSSDLLAAEPPLPFLQECTDWSCECVSIPQGVEEAAFEGCRFFTL